MCQLPGRSILQDKYKVRVHPFSCVMGKLNYCCVCRNAGKESSKERLGGSVLDKIPFLHGCEDDDDDDSDEEDDFQGMATDCIDGPRKNKKSRVKVGSWKCQVFFHL